MHKSVFWRLAVILALTASLVVLTDAWAAKQADAFKQLDLLVEVRHELVDSYVEEPDQLELIEAAVAGMVNSLEDPYTVFVPAKDVEQFSDRLTGSFSGIGAEIDMLDGRPRIVTPLEDSPAWKAGILAGDVILKVDGESTQDQDQMEVIRRIKGEPGTNVVLTVRRESGEELDITVTRAHINVQTVRGARRKADQSYDFMLDHVNKIGYVRLSQFTEPTVEELRSALEQLNEQGCKGLILDLRFDPGGLLDTAVAVSDMFLPAGKRIVSTKGRSWAEQVFDSTDDTIMPDTPLVVLANEGSASASEVVTGALSDNKRALFVGTRTFGKGSVQQVHALDSGLGALKLTGAYYYLPSGRNIHRKPDAEVWGVDPDEGAYVPMTNEAYEQMIKTRREADVLRPDNGHEESVEVTPEEIEQDLKDPQLAAALKAVLGKIDSGNWPTVGLSNAEELVKLRQKEQLERRRDLLLEELDKVEAELAGEVKAEAEAETAAPDAGKLLPEAAPKPEPKPAEVPADVKPEPKAEAKPKAEPAPKIEAQPEAKPKAEPKPEPKPEAKPEPKPEAKPKPAPKPEEKPAAKPAEEPAPKAEEKPAPNAEAKPEAKPEPTPEPEKTPEPAAQP
ncbi:MAG: S41 family peptidase [Phycisphaerales bacterium]